MARLVYGSKNKFMRRGRSVSVTDGKEFRLVDDIGVMLSKRDLKETSFGRRVVKRARGSKKK